MVVVTLVVAAMAVDSKEGAATTVEVSKEVAATMEVDSKEVMRTEVIKEVVPTKQLTHQN